MNKFKCLSLVISLSTIASVSMEEATRRLMERFGK